MMVFKTAPTVKNTQPDAGQQWPPALHAVGELSTASKPEEQRLVSGIHTVAVFMTEKVVSGEEFSHSCQGTDLHFHDCKCTCNCSYAVLELGFTFGRICQMLQHFDSTPHSKTLICTSLASAK